MDKKTGRKSSSSSKKKKTPAKGRKPAPPRGEKPELYVVGDNGPRPNSHPASNGERKPPVKKRRGTKRGLGAEAVVLAVSMVFFMISIGGSIIKFATKEDVSTMVVAQGSLDKPVMIQGLIIRDETVYYSDSEGEVTFHVADTDKVKAGTVVCSVQNASTVAALEAERDQLSKRILEMQEQRSSVSSVSSDVNAVNTAIKNTVDSNVHKLMGNDLSYLYTLQAGIEKNLEYRNELLLNENRGTVQAYVDENRQYTNKISEITSSLSTTSGGIVSYIVDGMEDVVTFDNMEYISKEQTTMDVEINPVEKVKETVAGEPVFKIVESNEWYIAAYIPNELVTSWNEGSSVEIYIEKEDGFETLSARVYSIYRAEKESFTILKSSKKIIDFLDMRTISFKTFDSIYNGIKLPESAIVEKTFLKVPTDYVYSISSGSSTVLKLVGDSVEQVYITTKSLKNTELEGDYVYVMQDYNNLKRGDTIISAGENPVQYKIEDIVTAKGVFKTNNGVAVFTSINTDKMIDGTGGYVILDTDSNSGTNGVNVYDRIVADAANINISEGDKIN